MRVWAEAYPSASPSCAKTAGRVANALLCFVGAYLKCSPRVRNGLRSRLSYIRAAQTGRELTVRTQLCPFLSGAHSSLEKRTKNVEKCIQSRHTFSFRLAARLFPISCCDLHLNEHPPPPFFIVNEQTFFFSIKNSFLLRFVLCISFFSKVLKKLWMKKRATM